MDCVFLRFAKGCKKRKKIRPLRGNEQSDRESCTKNGNASRKCATAKTCNLSLSKTQMVFKQREPSFYTYLITSFRVPVQFFICFSVFHEFMNWFFLNNNLSNCKVSPSQNQLTERKNSTGSELKVCSYEGYSNLVHLLSSFLLRFDKRLRLPSVQKIGRKRTNRISRDSKIRTSFFKNIC